MWWRHLLIIGLTRDHLSTQMVRGIPRASAEERRDEELVRPSAPRGNVQSAKPMFEEFGHEHLGPTQSADENVLSPWVSLLLAMFNCRVNLRHCGILRASCVFYGIRLPQAGAPWRPASHTHT